MPRQLSGAAWVERFPTSTSLTALKGQFQTSATRFVAALRGAGASVYIDATYRPPERAYLMHYAFRIAREGLDPLRVPALAGVEIDWAHRHASGELAVAASREAAEAMVRAYRIRRKPVLASRHTEGRAVDMTIRWQGTLRVLGPDGKEVVIADGPRTGDNPWLERTGEAYGLLHRVPKDPPHWSEDGR